MAADRLLRWLAADLLHGFATSCATRFREFDPKRDNDMKRMLTAVAVLGFVFGLTSVSALAQNGSGGTGSGNGVIVGCSSQANCGNVTVSSNSTSTGTGYSLSGPLTLSVTQSNPMVEAAVGDDLTPGFETLDFDLTNAFVSSGGTASGTFKLTDFFNGGDADFEIDGSILSLVASGTASAGTWTLTLDPTSVILGGSCECTGAGPVSISGVTGTITIDFDPGNVSGVTMGLGGGPFGGGTTPEPGTLTLLGAGLLGLGAAFRRRITFPGA